MSYVNTPTSTVRGTADLRGGQTLRARNTELHRPPQEAGRAGTKEREGVLRSVV
ncbi:MAG: hypothetical protein IJA91_06835 [Clostridia bacterium]|nr:hypothetical protein [Clostridia bacterium]